MTTKSCVHSVTVTEEPPIQLFPDRRNIARSFLSTRAIFTTRRATCTCGWSEKAYTNSEIQARASRHQIAELQKFLDEFDKNKKG